jgi:putative hydrolase of the HAD superfamily
MAAALLIDLDDTLLDDRGAMAAAVIRFRVKHGLARHLADQALATRWDEVGRALWKRLDSGELTFQEQRRIRLREVFSLALSDDEADSLFTDYLRFYEEGWALLPGADEFLAATSSIPRIVVTNGRRAQAERKLRALGVEGRFTGLVTPDDCGARKPDARIFIHALDLIGVSVSAAMMIGDSLEADIIPAMALGMATFHVNPLEAGRTIRDAAGAV